MPSVPLLSVGAARDGRMSPQTRPPAMVVAVLIFCAVAVGCASAGGSVDLPGGSGPSVDVLVQGAIHLEVQPLLDALEDARKVQLAAWTFWRGKIGSKSVVVSRTGAGPINAAASTTLGILSFRPRIVINQGTAGAHDPTLRIFDILVGRSTVDFGAFTSTDAGTGEGVSMSRWHPLGFVMSVDGHKHDFGTFPGDETALRIAGATTYAHGRVIPAIIGSAYEFNNEIDRLNWLRATYGTSSEDMESAFAAGVALGSTRPSWPSVSLRTPHSCPTSRSPSPPVTVRSSSSL